MTDSDCIFCRIISRQIPANVVAEDDMSISFRDLNPQAPVHVLIVPKKHVASLAESEQADAMLFGHLVMAAKKIAKQEGLKKNGYRLVINNGANAGQTVFHFHVHLLGGRSFSWPPG